MPNPKQLREREVTKQIVDFLRWRGWRPVRMMRTVVPGQFQAGEPGMPDFFFVKYLDAAREDTGKKTGRCYCMWIEMKRSSRGKLSEAQRKWRERERGRGALVTLADDIDFFSAWYQEKFGWMHDPGTGAGQFELRFPAGNM
jgi:hypothetical protein